ncbi:hypothetical protein [Sutcliffiella rhizosphaerae]|uniref:hypothetical protein n=1 Tax=Sutcliffiella rhizosphaerae TaxID=2880967 RepID=UPI001E474309|nr:hypothetical protein [Sutcliffiella rhizosphaerae]
MINNFKNEPTFVNAIVSNDTDSPDELQVMKYGKELKILVCLSFFLFSSQLPIIYMGKPPLNLT